MLFSYKECLEKFGSAYQIRRAVECGELRYICKGVYSDQGYVSELAVLRMKYPNAVITMRNAFYYHGLTDVIPDQYDLATERSAAKIKNDNVVQYFYPVTFFTQGITEMNYQGTEIRIYNKERMLIELLRYQTKLPFDYYKEIITSYRKILTGLDIEKVEEYASEAPNSEKVMGRLQTEVF